MAKDTYYFSHDSNARNDPKIACLRKKYGWVGYGLYWAIIEVLRDQPCYSYPQALLDGLAIAVGWDSNDPQVDGILFNDFISFCSNIGLLIIENDTLKSMSLINRMQALDDKRQRLAEAGRIGGLKSSHAKATYAQAMLKPPSSSKVKESKVNKNSNTIYDFECLWIKYPKKLGKHSAMQFFTKQVLTNEDFSNITKALENFIASDIVKGDPKFIPHGSTWFNERWRDWVDISNATGKSQAYHDLMEMADGKHS